MKNKILIVCAHPDDEVLGCGATVKLWSLAGAEIRSVIMTGGVAGRLRNLDPSAARLKEMQQMRRTESIDAAQLLGIGRVDQLDFPDNRMDTVSRMDVAQAIGDVIRDFRPELVLTHHAGDYNWDHTYTFDAVLMAARANVGDWYPDEIWSFEVLSSTERAWQEPGRAFMPNVFVDVATTLETKKAALKCYRSEYRDWPHPRSVEAVEHLARKRGAEVGLHAAEAFHCIRRIERA